jgi:hypothetical protein
MYDLWHMIRHGSNTMFNPVLLFMLVILTTSCRDRARAVASEPAADPEVNIQTPPPVTEPVAQTHQHPDSLVFHLHRTACFGPCPAYRISIYASGHATYEGYGHVDRMGHYETHVDDGVRSALRQEAERRGFFELQDRYDSPVTDLPSTIIAVRANGHTKEVTGRVGTPQALKDLATKADELLLGLDWRPVPEGDR